MGTLTANTPHLPEYCAHKLPSSCRLSSIPQCCACADERAHAPSYSVYIDGIGYVPRGNRWQRYCWFCKEFWEARVSASGLRPAQTRIPTVPDQTEFLGRWYEFYHGYRIVKQEDGTEEKIAVLGEDFCDVSPGELPRTLEQLRAGRDREVVGRIEQLPTSPEEVDTGPSLDDALEQMLADAANDETNSRPQPAAVPRPYVPTGPPNRSAQVIVPTGPRGQEYHARRVAALRRELHRMRNGIERVIMGLQELGEAVPDHSEATQRLSALGERLDAISGIASRDEAQRAIESVNSLAQSSGATQPEGPLAVIGRDVHAARQHLEEARRARDQAASELDLAETEFQTSQRRAQQLQREQRTMENYLRLFGSREDMIAQGENYESPIGAMFTRADERFRAAEDVRREQRTLRQVLDDEARVDEDEVARRLAELSTRPRDVWGVPRPTAADIDSIAGRRQNETALEEYYALVRSQERGMQVPLEPTADHPPAAQIEGQPQLDISPATSDAETWEREILALLAHLEDNSFSRNPFSIVPVEVRELRSRVTDGNLTDEDRAKLDEMINNATLLMRSGLLSSRLARRRRAGERITFIQNPSGPMEHMQNVEIMAEAFQMSAQVRRHAQGLTGPQQLRMLYRLQEGQRASEDDILTLEWLVGRPQIVEIASRVHNEQTSGALPEVSNRQLFREGRTPSIHHLAAFSRQRATAPIVSRGDVASAYALTAGRLAMQAGPDTIFEHLANRDVETRAVVQRMRDNGFNLNDEQTAYLRAMTFDDWRREVERSDGGNEDEDDEEEDEEEEDQERGLDAPDTGRPEPKTDEEMNVQMECRICYTQVAEVACLPCGHLVMCKWCSEQHSPTMAQDRTRPRRAAGCPVCRKGIRQKVRVFRA